VLLAISAQVKELNRVRSAMLGKQVLLSVPQVSLHASLAQLENSAHLQEHLLVQTVLQENSALEVQLVAVSNVLQEHLAPQ
jgi:hypothetical protein